MTKSAMHMFATLKQNLTFSLRSFLKNPGFTATVVLTIALGIGASTAIFSVLYSTLFEPLPYTKSDQLMMVWSKTSFGRRSDHVLTFNLPVSQGRLKEIEKIGPYYSELLDRIKAVPGVEHAALTTGLPTRGTGFGMGFSINEPGEDRTDLPSAGVQLVTAGYHDTFGIRILKGRNFDDRDTQKSIRVAMINEKFAQTYFAGVDPIGQRLWINEIIPPGKIQPKVPWEVVGVFNTVRNDGLRSEYPQIDLPFWQMPWPGISAVVRTQGDPTAITKSIGAAITSVDSDLPLAAVKTMDEVLSDQYAGDRFALALFGSFAVAALLLAALGVYGVMAFGVAQRTQEFGIRIALGAQRESVIRLVLKEGVILALIGSAVGLGGAYLVGRLMASTLYGVQAFETSAFVAVVLLLLVAALLASLLPAWRACRVNPIDALRGE